MKVFQVLFIFATLLCSIGTLLSADDNSFVSAAFLAGALWTSFMAVFCVWCENIRDAVIAMKIAENSQQQSLDSI